MVDQGHNRRWRPLLAAAVVFLALGWGWQRGIGAKKLQAEVIELRQRLATAEAELRRPWVNVRVARLLAGDDPLRSSSTPPLSLGKTGNVVLIQTPEPLPTGRYTVEIRSPTDEVIHRIEDLEPQKIGLSFFLPSAALEPANTGCGCSEAALKSTRRLSSFGFLSDSRAPARPLLRDSLTEGRESTEDRPALGPGVGMELSRWLAAQCLLARPIASRL